MKKLKGRYQSKLHVNTVQLWSQNGLKPLTMNATNAVVFEGCLLPCGEGLSQQRYARSRR